MLRSALAWLVVLPFAVWALVRVSGWDAGWPAPQLLPFTPIVAAGAVVAVVVAVILRRFGAAAVGLVSALALVGVVAPRAFGDGGEASASSGAGALRVLTLNLHGDAAEPSDVVALVRRTRADVLSLQELTPQGVTRLERAGLRDVLAQRHVQPRPGSAGTGLYARRPLSVELSPMNTAYALAAARVQASDGRPVRILAVHTQAPVGPGAVPGWLDDFRVLRGWREADVPDVLAGDFNATLDHPQLRDLLDAGYVDAADATGDGLTPTWPEHRRVPPLITIDHVLASRGSRFGDVSIHSVNGSDHRAVLAEVLLP